MGKWTTADIPDQTGRTAVITGANTGLGYETATALAAKGAHVVLAVRNLEKGTEAARGIEQAITGAGVTVQELDLLRDGHAIVGDRGGAPLLLEDDVAALGPQGHLYRVGEAVQAPLEAATGLFVIRNCLGHCEVFLRIGDGTSLAGCSARDGRLWVCSARAAPCLTGPT